jgi:hypothetical protein
MRFAEKRKWIDDNPAIETESSQGSIQEEGLVGAVGIEVVGQSPSLAAPFHTSKILLEHRILATSWPRILFLDNAAASSRRRLNCTGGFPNSVSNQEVRQTDGSSLLQI